MPLWNLLVNFIVESVRYLNELTGNTGLAIILLTIIVKTLVLPLTLPALRNSRRQQELAPMVREIQKKHPKDRAAASAEQMALYRQYGFNPLAGCLPTLVQLPIWLALYSALQRLPRVVGPNELTGFLWLESIARPDPLHLIPVLAALAQFVQTRMSMQTPAQYLDPQQKQMNTMLQFMPLLVIVFGWGLASGLVLYWFISALYSAVLQFFVTGWGSLSDLLPFLPKRQPKSYLPQPLPDGHHGKPGFMQRLNERMLEAQRQQQELQAQKQGGAQNVVPRSTAGEERGSADQSGPELVPTEGVRFTDDPWRLPGAPGSNGRAVYATSSPATEDRATQIGPTRTRQNNRRRKRK